MVKLTNMQTIPWQKIKALEDEIKQLKSVNKPVKKTKGKSLYGILKGVKVSEKDFKDAEESLFTHTK